MKIEHIAMYVNDLEKCEVFLKLISVLIPMRGITIPKRISVLIF
jgi:hypothetical protein